jgi:hypothetical protein
MTANNEGKGKGKADDKVDGKNDGTVEGKGDSKGAAGGTRLRLAADVDIAAIASKYELVSEWVGGWVKEGGREGMSG